MRKPAAKLYPLGPPKHWGDDCCDRAAILAKRLAKQALFLVDDERFGQAERISGGDGDTVAGGGDVPAERELIGAGWQIKVMAGGEEFAGEPAGCWAGPSDGDAVPLGDDMVLGTQDVQEKAQALV